MSRYLFFLLAVMTLFSCRSARVSNVSVTPENEVVRLYLEQYAALAVSEMRRTGIPASIKLAQGMIESDHGRSRLATQANNHFGIKCHSSWTGPMVYHDDDETDECFRSYRNAEQSFIDHSDFLLNGSRYSSLFDLRPTDYRGWARGLSRAGYATNPAYADMLIRKIENNNLQLYDRVGTGSSAGGRTNVRERPATLRGSRFGAEAAARVMVRNRVNYIIVAEGDSYETLRRDFNLRSGEIERYNERPVDELLVPGNILYLQPKRKRAEVGYRHHTVREGETMHEISQHYAIRVEELYKLNFMEKGSEPEPGRQILLR